MKKKLYKKNIYNIYLSREELELILNSFDFYLNIFKNLKNTYCISNKEYYEIYKKYNNFAQRIYNIYIDKL